KNITHQQKKLKEDELREVRARLQIPISDEEITRVPFFRPPEESPEMVYLRARRQALGGFLPARRSPAVALAPPPSELFAELRTGSGDRAVTTTAALVRLLTKLLRDP